MTKVLVYTPEFSGSPTADEQFRYIQGEIAVPPGTVKHKSIETVLMVAEAGGLVLVAGLYLFGPDRDGIEAALNRCEQAGLSVYTVDTRQKVVWSPEVRHTLCSFRKAEAKLHALRVIQGQRASAKRSGRRPRALPDGTDWRAAWLDPQQDADDTAARAGVSRWSMYRRYGPRRPT